MSQNRSSAVMQQRIEADDSLDDFATPPWATRALLKYFIEPLSMRYALNYDYLCEPCCNRGYMARPLREAFRNVYATDIESYGWDGMDKQEDFLFPGYETPFPINWTIANPPFRLAEQFILKALRISQFGCAMFVRTSFLEGVERFRNLYDVERPSVVAQFAERVILTKGAPRDPSKKYWDAEAINKKTGKKGMWKTPSTATSYCWIIWRKGDTDTRMRWIPPCRRDLERPGDYPVIHNPDAPAPLLAQE